MDKILYSHFYMNGKFVDHGRLTKPPEIGGKIPYFYDTYLTVSSFSVLSEGDNHVIYRIDLPEYF